MVSHCTLKNSRLFCSSELTKLSKVIHSQITGYFLEFHFSSFQVCMYRCSLTFCRKWEYYYIYSSTYVILRDLAFLYKNHACVTGDVCVQKADNEHSGSSYFIKYSFLWENSSPTKILRNLIQSEKKTCFYFLRDMSSIFCFMMIMHIIDTRAHLSKGKKQTVCVED